MHVSWPLGDDDALGPVGRSSTPWLICSYSVRGIGGTGVVFYVRVLGLKFGVWSLRVPARCRWLCMRTVGNVSGWVGVYVARAFRG